MASSEIRVSPVQNTKGETYGVHITAYGGTRRERGAAIAAAVRNYGKTLRRYHISYSETYGFQSATYARYEITR
jgi:hypothetical protein